VGCDQLFYGFLALYGGISIHAPSWGATAILQVYCQGNNPISIHAPSWGATFPQNWVFMALLISIHAPSWGATPLPAMTCVTLTDFNPRTLVGCDVRLAVLAPTEMDISIHAPSWGATQP